MKKPAIFLDRDGVINRDRLDYVKSWAEFEFLPGVLEALRRLARLPYTIVVLSNQSVIGQGLVSQAVIDDIHVRMQAAIQQTGGRVDAVYYCPHHPHAGCDCRKPRPGLLLRAARELNLDLLASWFIGDDLRDLQAAVAAGVQPILVRTGHGGSVSDDQLCALPAHTKVFANLFHAVCGLLECHQVNWHDHHCSYDPRQAR